MSSAAQITEKSYQKYAWIILLVISILLALNMLFLIAESGPEMFQADTGMAAVVALIGLVLPIRKFFPKDV